MWTARVETAPRRGIEWARDLAWQQDLFMHVIGMGWQGVAEQHPGVGMQRVGIKLFARRSFDQLTELYGS
jgi:hypothetical protein